MRVERTQLDIGLLYSSAPLACRHRCSVGEKPIYFAHHAFVGLFHTQEPADELSDTLCCLALPADLSVAQFCGFCGAYLAQVSQAGCILMDNLQLFLPTSSDVTWQLSRHPRCSPHDGSSSMVQVESSFF